MITIGSSYKSVFGMNVMRHQYLIFKLVGNQPFNQSKSLCITEEINAWLDLVIRILNAKQIKLAVRSKFCCKVC